MLKKIKNKVVGFGGIEVLLAGSIMTLVMVSLLGLLFYSNDSLNKDNSTSQASLIASQSLEIVSGIRDRGFSNLVDGVYGLSRSEGEWFFVSESDQVDRFTRTITISTISENVKKVAVSVNWSKSPGRLVGISLYKYFTNWQGVENYDCDRWFGDGQYFSYNQTSCDKGDLVLSEVSTLYEGLASNGNSLEFSLNSDYVQTEFTAADLNIDGNKPRTIELWAKTYSFTDKESLFAFGAPASSGRDFSLRTLNSDNRWRLQLWGSYDLDFNYTSLNKWVHFAVVHDGSKTSIYADGVLLAEREQVLDTVSDQFLTIAWWPYWSLPSTFNGRIREFRVWDKALSQSEILNNISKQLLGNEPNLVAYWPLDEGSGSDVLEKVSATNSSLINNPDWVKDVPSSSEFFLNGHRVSKVYSLDEYKNVTSSNISWLKEIQDFKTSLNFNGSPNYVLINNSNELNPGNITLSSWVKWNIDPGTGSPWATIVNKDGDNHYRLQHNSDNTAFEFGVRTVNGGRHVTGTTIPQQGVWYFVVGTYDGSFLKIYVNGILEGTTSLSGNLLISNTDVNIGRRVSGDRYFNGQIDEVRIYNRALNSEEIVENMYQEIKSPLSDNSLVAYYKFNEESGDIAVDSSNNSNNASIFFSISEPYRSPSQSFSEVEIYTAISDSQTVEPSSYDLAENNSSIIGISDGDNLSGKYLWIKQELETYNIYNTPRLKNLSFNIESDELVLDEVDYLIIDKTNSQVSSVDRNRLIGTELSSTNINNAISIDKIKLIWSGINSNTKINLVDVNGYSVWSGSLSSGSEIDLLPNLELTSLLSPYSIEFDFSRRIAGIDLIAQFIMSDGSIKNSHITSGNFNIDIEISNDWETGYCADVTISTDATNPVIWDARIFLDEYPLIGEPYNVWDANWSYSEPIFSASGLAYNDTVTSGSPAYWGYCANRPEIVYPPGVANYDIVITSDWTSGYCADVNVSTESETPITWEAEVDLSNYPNNGIPNSVWSSDWSFSFPILYARGLDWNKTISSGSPSSFGYCADRVEPEEKDYFQVDINSAVIGPAPLSNSNISGILLDNNSASSVSIKSIGGSWTSRRLQEVFINDVSVWTGNVRSGQTAIFSTPYVLTPGSGPHNLRLRFNNRFTGQTINYLDFTLFDDSVKRSGSKSF